MNAWHAIRTIGKRELVSYFTSPVAYVFLVIFLLLTGFLTFTAGAFFERGEACMGAFFGWHPWLYLVLVPAVGMRLWAEERRAGTLELLLTMPVAAWQAILGKFLASWAFLAIALALTFPVVITANVLGDPDNGMIFAGYLGSLFLAGAYLVLTGHRHLFGLQMVTQPLDAEALLSLYLLLAAIADPVRKLSSVYTRIQSGFAAADRIFQLAAQAVQVGARLIQLGVDVSQDDGPGNVGDPLAGPRTGRIQYRHKLDCSRPDPDRGHLDGRAGPPQTLCRRPGHPAPAISRRRDRGGGLSALGRRRLYNRATPGRERRLRL